MKRIILPALLILLAACAPAQIVSPTVASVPPTSAPVEFTAIPTLTSAPATVPPFVFDLDNHGMTVVYDFTSRLCEAKWVNSVDPKGLPCPGDLNNTGKGYVSLLSGSDQGLDAAFAMIMTVPARDNAGGLFGRFPAITLGPNDEFRAYFTCRSDADCGVEFTLGYYDTNGKYYEPFDVNYYVTNVEPPIHYIESLRSLAGQTVELVLVVRAMQQRDPAQAWGLWISPRILRP